VVDETPLIMIIFGEVVEILQLLEVQFMMDQAPILIVSDRVRMDIMFLQL
jgi:hypothetical protein